MYSISIQMSLRTKLCKECGEANNVRAVACISCGESSSKCGCPHGTTQQAGYAVSDGRPHGTTQEAGLGDHVVTLGDAQNSTIQYSDSNDLVNISDELLDACSRRISQ